ncbi:MAG: hypothetical protein ACREL5_13300, partial [Gemmatimonadales bacterium]
VYTWAPSGNERRHNFQLSIQWPITPALELTSTASLTSGSHYTPIVAGDINGDGSSRDDRAFIYNPLDAADTAVANGMRRLLASTSGNARKCLQSQLGEIASRNSCTGPWSPRLDIQVNWRPALFDRRLSLSLQTINLLGGLDQWINGSDNLKGWGGNARPDNTLLTVHGFDPATDRFEYVVNERFGNTSAGATAVRQPFQIAINARFAIGFDARTLQLQSLGRGSAVRPNARSIVDSFLVRYRRQDAATAALDRADTLALTPAQLTALRVVADSDSTFMQPHIDSLMAAVDTVLKANTAADVVPLLNRYRAFNAVAVREQAVVHDKVRQILSPVQWALLPDYVRTPSNNLVGGGRGGGFGGRGGRGGRGPGGG